MRLSCSLRGKILLHSEILYDRAGALTRLQNKYKIKYPEQLRQNIIEKNVRLLDGYIPSYSDQIVKASERMEIVSVNHRTTEFIASYFDILFAYNEVTHPVEASVSSIRNLKRMLN